MELRKVETEVNDIFTSYNALQRKKLCAENIGDTNDIVNLSNLPSLMDISSQVEGKINNEGDAIMETSEDGDGNGDNDGDNVKAVIEIYVRDALVELESFQSRLSDIQSKIERFRKRSTERDPVTDAPRYGEKTLARVKTLIGAYDALVLALKITFGEEPSPSLPPSSIVDEMKRIIQSEEDTKKKTKMDALSAAEAREAQLKKEAVIAAEREAQKKAQEEEERKKEEAELALRAEEARKLRIENERRAEEEAREADRAFVASVPRGGDGVRAQIGLIREACRSNTDGSGEKEWNTAIGALHTIFTQIMSRPEEPKFRRIRRDHPKFLEDVGRHPGGKEIFIASGFRLDNIEGVSCFFSKEPNIEHDMDGWSDWFNELKETLQIIEEEMIK